MSRYYNKKNIKNFNKRAFVKKGTRHLSRHEIRLVERMLEKIVEKRIEKRVEKRVEKKLSSKDNYHFIHEGISLYIIYCLSCLFISAVLFSFTYCFEH